MIHLMGYIFVNIVHTLLRVFPSPSKTGLIRIGAPDRNSLVFLTCNYRLTLERVKKALRGVDCYLLVANSRGINVWCAATGGLLTNHDVVSVLKTSGIEELVDHRKVVLPQLAATGVEEKTLRRMTGWKVIWGPVYAKDIPAFMENKLMKTTEMRMVGFTWTERIEMAVAWAFPISVVSALIAFAFWRGAIPHLILMIWGLSFLVFVSFPLYSDWLAPRSGKRIGFIFFDFVLGGIQLILWSAFLAGLAVYLNLTGDFSWEFIFRWGFLSFVAILILSLDLTGSTPIYKSGLHEDRLLEIVLDRDKCKGAGFCEQVCPKNCFIVDKVQHIATMPRAHECVQCGACIVQCPFDALYFKSTKGGSIPPDTIRKFKLNLIGKRDVSSKSK
jgi:ferredoxin